MLVLIGSRVLFRGKPLHTPKGVEVGGKLEYQTGDRPLAEASPVHTAEQQQVFMMREAIPLGTMQRT